MRSILSSVKGLVFFSFSSSSSLTVASVWDKYLLKERNRNNRWGVFATLRDGWYCKKHNAQVHASIGFLRSYYFCIARGNIDQIIAPSLILYLVVVGVLLSYKYYYAYYLLTALADFLVLALVLIVQW
jgi:hypothetical protein